MKNEIMNVSWHTDPNDNRKGIRPTFSQKTPNGFVGLLNLGGRNITDEQNKTDSPTNYICSVHGVDGENSRALALNISSQINRDLLITEKGARGQLEG